LLEGTFILNLIDLQIKTKKQEEENKYMKNSFDLHMEHLKGNNEQAGIVAHEYFIDMGTCF